MIPIITIDGPVSSGKGTVARLVAARLAWHLGHERDLVDALMAKRGIAS